MRRSRNRPRSEKAYDQYQTVEERDGFDGERAQRARDAIDQHDRAAARADTRASVELWVAHVGTGACVGIL